jgi:Domain of unknown function (DUF4168)
MNARSKLNATLSWNTRLKLNATLNLDAVMNSMAYLSLPRISLSRLAPSRLAPLVQAIAIGSLSVASFATVITMPNLITQDHGVAMAQDGDTFERYVRAAFEIEKERRGMMGQVKTITGGNVPNNVCRNLGQIGDEGQRNQVKGICDKFAKFAAEAVKRQRLSSQEFNKYQSQASSMRSQVNEMIQKLDLK